MPPPLSCPGALSAAPNTSVRFFLEDTACSGHQHTFLVSFLYTYSHWHMYKSNTDCDPWLQKVKPAAFNPLVSHSKALALLLSTPSKMEHCLVTMVTKHFSAGNHHPELRSSLLCEAQARVLTHGQFPLAVQPCWGFPPAPPPPSRTRYSNTGA